MTSLHTWKQNLEYLEESKQIFLCGKQPSMLLTLQRWQTKQTDGPPRECGQSPSYNEAIYVKEKHYKVTLFFFLKRFILDATDWDATNNRLKALINSCRRRQNEQANNDVN